MMPSNASTRFRQNTQEVDRLSEIHQQLGGRRRGRREQRLEVLNKSAVVLITACWEAYVEDVAREAFDFMLNNTRRAATLSGSVRELAARDLHADKNQLRIWDLSGEGWRDVMRLYRDGVLERFHSPKSDNVDAMFLKLLGMRKLSTSWYWRGMSARAARSKLDRYVDIRGRIAHRVQYRTPVRKWWAQDYLSHVIRLVAVTERVLSQRIRNRIGNAPPW